MKPVLFSFGSIELSSYALMLSLGACVALWLTHRESLRTGLDSRGMVVFATLSFAGAVAGARGLSWALHQPLYADQPWWSALAVWDGGGMSVYGGLTLAMLVGLAYARLRGLPIRDAADTLVVCWVPFLAFVRVGCFLNGCCYGRPTTSPFGLVAGGSPNHVGFGIPSHPTQLYEVVATLAIFAVLWRMRTRRRFPGQLTVTFLVLYPAFRYFNDFLRDDTRLAWSIGEWLTLSLNQWISLAVVGLALVVTRVLARRSGRRGSQG